MYYSLWSCPSIAFSVIKASSGNANEYIFLTSSYRWKEILTFYYSANFSQYFFSLVICFLTSPTSCSAENAAQSRFYYLILELKLMADEYFVVWLAPRGSKILKTENPAPYCNSRKIAGGLTRPKPGFNALLMTHSPAPSPGGFEFNKMPVNRDKCDHRKWGNSWDLRTKN